MNAKVLPNDPRRGASLTQEVCKLDNPRCMWLRLRRHCKVPNHVIHKRSGEFSKLRIGWSGVEKGHSKGGAVKVHGKVFT